MNHSDEYDPDRMAAITRLFSQRYREKSLAEGNRPTSEREHTLAGILKEQTAGSVGENAQSAVERSP